MGLISFLITLIAGGTVIVDDINKSNSSINNRYDAKINGQAWYWDGENSRRSVTTNEIVSSISHNGYTKYVGVKSGHVYQDTMHDKNEKLMAQGKKFIYKEIPTNNSLNAEMKVWTWDLEKNLPFILKLKLGDVSCGKCEEQYMLLEYYQFDDNCILRRKCSLDRKIYRSDPEYQKYMP